jgi:hypothetical protein
MITEDFTGYGARIDIHLGRSMNGDELREMIERYMSRISLDCVDEGVKLIGHIKSITDTEDKGYLACSVTNHKGKVRSEGNLGDTSSLEMILNVMIYGLDMEIVERIVERRTSEYFASNGASFELEILEGEEDHDHDYDHARSNVTLQQ